MVLFDDAEYAKRGHTGVAAFDAFFTLGLHSRISELAFVQRMSLVRPSDVLNLQFTSGKYIQLGQSGVSLIGQAPLAPRRQLCSHICKSPSSTERSGSHTHAS